MSLFDEQSSTESDFLSGPGFTPDTTPSTFEGFGPLTQAKATTAGAIDMFGTLAHGLPGLVHNVLQSGAYMGAAEQGSDSDEAVQGVKEFEQPWAPKLAEVADTIQQTARAQAKSLMPDPAVSGTGTNLIYGFTKSASEAALTTAATRNPMAAAPLFGYLQGMGHYQDLRDQGVDDATAQKSATLQGVLAAGSFAVPGGLPVKWLDEMGPATQAITQLGAGAAINTASGMVSRYGTAQILENAGYHELAEQNRVLDGQAMIADILSGAFFGGVHFFHGRAQELADTATRMAQSGELDPSVRDGAKVAQDNRAASVDRAPGVPVDGATAGAHRAALEKAVSDVLSDRPVDVSDELDDSHLFAARPEDPETTLSAREMVHREFIDAGVMGEASDVDAMEHHLERIYRGESVPPYEGEVRIPTDVPRETNQADTTGVLDQPAERPPTLAKPSTSDYIVARGGKDKFPILIDREKMMRNRLEKPVGLKQAGVSEEHNDLLSQSMNKEARDSFDAEGKFTGKPYQVTTAGGVYLHDSLQSARNFAETHGMKKGTRRALQDQAKAPEPPAGTISGDEAMTNLKESQDTDEGPKMIGLAAKCAGMTR